MFDTTAIVTFSVFTAIVAIASWYMTRGENLSTSEGYFLGGRHLGWFLVGGSLFLSNISAIAIIGETQSAYDVNMTIMMFGFSSIVAMVIVSEFILPIYLRFGVTTTPEFLGLRYDDTLKSWVAVLFVLAYVINLMPPVLYTGAVVFNGMFNIDEMLGISEWTAIWILVWAIGIVGSAYAIFGGLKAIAASDALNGIGLVIGGILVPYFGLKFIGGGDLFAGWDKLVDAHPDHLNSIGKPTDPVPWTTLFTGMLLVNLNYWAAEQYILQRTLGARNLSAGQKGMMFGASLKFIAPLLTVFPGVVALLVLPNLANSNEAYPQLVAAVLPPYLIGFIAAVMFGAALTTFNSGLNSTSTVAVLNLYQPYRAKRGKELDDRALIRLGKTTQVVLAFASMTIAPFIYFASDGFYEYFQKVAGLFSIPIFTLVFVGFVTKRVPPLAAKIALVLYLVCYSYTQLVNDFGIHWLHIVAILFVLNVSIMLIFGRFLPTKSSFERPAQGAVDLTPWRHRYFAYFLVLVGMGTVVWWLSPFGIAEW